MNDASYYAARDDRLFRYPQARRLDQSRWIAIRATPAYINSYAGQVAVLTASNLLGRMARRVVLDIPATAMVEPLPWAGKQLGAFALAQMRTSDPRGEFRLRPVIDGDHIIQLGLSGGPTVTHGTGWLAYHGPSPSPLQEDHSPNPIGAALGVVAAAARLSVHGFEPPIAAIGINAFNWNHDIVGGSLPEAPCEPELGSIWTVGTGSVGTAILYFLSLATRNFSAALFDGDSVKRENITRSPIFTEADIGSAKAPVAGAYLNSCGVTDVKAEPVALHRSRTWQCRPAGTPDLVIAAANEHNVRHLIESLFPPVQIYGTTGKNWQATLVRHIPMRDPCSCCLFPEGTFAPTECATDEKAAANSGPQIDASLPFLSFAAGLMAAAEILKLQISHYPMTANRTCLTTWPDLRLVAANAPLRDGCICGNRSRAVHGQMIEGSRYVALSARP